MRVSVQDARNNPTGIQKAYFDLTYPSSFVSVDGAVTHGSAYNLATSGDVSTAGLIDEVGGFDSDAFPPASPGNEFLLFSVPLRAQAAGVATFTPDPAESPVRVVQFFDQQILPLNEVQFVGNSIEVIADGGGGPPAAINVTPVSGLVTTEAGGTATFQLSLSRQPTANVTIGLSSSDTSEGTVSPTSVTFTTANWNSPQTVTVTGVNDLIDDGNIAYTVITAPATSGDQAFNGLNPADVAVTNSDDDVPGFVVVPTSGLVTGEDGTTATFQVSLMSQPTANVTVTLSSSNTSEGTVSPATLEFTAANFNTPQTVTVQGVNGDAIRDGDVAYTIVTAPATSSDPSYNGRDPADVQVTNRDNDNPGFTVVPTSGLTTTEAGGTATFQISLTSQPTADVSVGFSSSDESEGIPSPSSVVFTAANWNVPRTITVTGVNDDIDDDGVAYTIITAPATSADPNYNGLNPSDVNATNSDDEVAGFSVVPTSGLVTTEGGGTATFQIRLTSQPSMDVVVGLSSSDAGEATVSPSSVTFTPANWNVAQTVTATGVDDLRDDGDVEYTIVTAPATSGDARYNGVNPSDVLATNVDNDQAGFMIVPTAGLATNEQGGTATFQIQLSARPTADVTIGLSSSAPGEGTVSTPSVTFTQENWNVPQTVTVTGVDDLVDDGDRPYSIVTAPAVSADSSFNGLNPVDVSVVNADNDEAGFVVTQSGSPTEAGGTATIQISLSSQPTADVSIGVSSSDTSEGLVAPVNVVFTPANWNVPRSVTVTGIDDPIDDGDVTFTVVLAAATSADSVYNGLNPTDVTVTNVDNDEAGFVVVPTSGLTTTEAGGTASFQISLTAQPSANVTISWSSSDSSEGTVTPTSLTFTPANWNVAQTVTVTGVDDALDDGDVNYTVVSAPAQSADPAYQNRDAADVAVTNTDDDDPTIVVTPTTGLTTTEAGGTATFEIVLSSAPSSDVTIDLTSSDPGEATVGTARLLFTPANWNVPQVVTVTGVDDGVVDGARTVTIVTAPADSADSAFAGLDPANVSIVNEDDDTATVTISAPEPQAEGTGDGVTEFVFQVTLSAAVEGGFAVPFTTNDDTATAAEGDYVDNDGSLTFDGTAGETHTITVQVDQDNIVELDEQFHIALGQLLNVDPLIAERIAVHGSPASATILNDDTTTVTLVPISAAQPEGTGGTTTEFTFEVRLSAPVQGGFDLAFTTDDGTATAADGDYVDQDGSVCFNGEAGEVKTITVQVQHDQKVEADELFQVVLSELSNVDPALAESIVVDRTPATGTIENDDSATLTLTVVDAVQEEGNGTGTVEYIFEIALSNPVQGGVSVPFQTADGTATVADDDYVSADGLLTFSGGAAETQRVTVLVNQDQKIEPNETFEFSLGDLQDIDPAIAAGITFDPGPVTATIVNDDFPRVTLTVSATSAPEDGSGEGAEFTFTLTLSDAVNDPDGFDVPYFTNDGTATAASGDYVDNDGVIHFDGTAGESHSFTVRVNTDTTVERNETVTVALDAISGLAEGETVILEGSPVTLTIENDDAAMLTLSAETLELLEGTASGNGELQFEVRLSAAVQDGFSVRYATNDGTATSADGDYVDNDGELAFEGTAGETHLISVPFSRDSKVETDESFQVALGELLDLHPEVAASLTVSGGPLTATLRNDDTTEVRLVPVSAAQNEGTGGGATEFRFEAQLTNPVQGGFAIAYSVTDGTATVAGGDYTGTGGTLTFTGLAGEVQPIVVPVQRDAVVERDERFTVELGDLSAISAELAANVDVDTTPLEATVVNDDTATVSFASPSSSTLEALGEHSVDVVLTVSNGGSLSEPLVLSVSVLGSSTAGAEDFVLNTSTITFPAGSQDGDRRAIDLTLATDAVFEELETIDLEIEIEGEDAGGAVTLGTSQHAVALTDDPHTGRIAGQVWIDANANGQIDASEWGVPGVMVQLSGQDLLGRTVEISKMTAADGTYAFEGLPGGTYRVRQLQPAALHDGQEVYLGGENAGDVVVGSDEISGITIAPAQQVAGVHFSEVGLRSQYVNARLFLASTPQRMQMLWQIVAHAAEQAGQGAEAAVIRQGAAVEIRRLGAEVTVVGTNQKDVLKFVPASSAEGSHSIDANGILWAFPASAVSSFKFQGGGGNDDLVLDDTAGNEQLRATHDAVFLSGEDYEVETSAIEFIRALSNSGGQDTAENLDELVDAVIQLEGNWQLS